MPNWLIFALGAALLWAATNVLDKVIVSKTVSSPIVYVVIEAAFGCVPLFAAIVLDLVRPASLYGVAIGLLTGILLFMFDILYVSALRFATVSSVALTLQGGAAVTVLIGVIGFKEQYSLVAYVGIGLVLSAASSAAWLSTEEPFQRQGVSSENDQSHRSSAARFLLVMVPAIIVGSVSFGLQKLASRYVDVATVYAMGRLGFLSAVPMLMAARTARRDIANFFTNATMRATSASVIGIAVAQMLNLGALLLILLAYANGPVALVATAGASQPLIVLLLILLINASHLRLLPESENTWKSWAVRVSLTMVLASGVFLLNWHP